MSISTSELLALLRGTLRGAAPTERRQILTYIDMVDRCGVTAHLYSESSQFLRRTADEFAGVFQSDIAGEMADVDLYGVELPLVNAFARVETDRRQVIMFEGIRQVVLYYAHLVTVLNLLQTLRPGKRILIDGWEEQESAAFSMAGFSILADYLHTGQPLIAVDDILGPLALDNVRQGYAATVAFLLAHELGHLVLGHAGRRGVVSQRNQVSLAIEEDINQYQSDEFEADRFALMAFQDDLRPMLMSSVIFFLGPLAFMEAFARPKGESHPLFTNRAAHLGSLIPGGSADAVAVRTIIDSQIEGFRSVSAIREDANGDIRHRIHETMPLDLASRVIHTVKQTVRMESGVLDA